MPDPVPDNQNNNNNSSTPPGNDPKSTDNGGNNNQNQNQNNQNQNQNQNQNDNGQMIPKHRFDEVNTRLQALEAEKQQREAEQKAKEEEDLKKKGEFETLAQKHKAEAEEAKAALTTERQNNAIAREAAKQGIQDLDAAIKLIDRANIKTDKDGNITGIEDAVKTLVESKPYLKSGVPQPTVGGGTNPGEGGANNTPRFKHSQLQDAKFYREHEKEITEALAKGLVEDDLAQH